MPQTYFTADPHFGHENIIRLCKRPFRTIEEHDNELVARWNARVSRSDTIYVVGDFAYRDDPERVLRRLNGQKHLVIGNHDKKATLRLPWASPPRERIFLKLDGESIVLDHYGGRTWNGSFRGSFQFYGHSHGRLPGLGNSTDVGVDAWDFAPATLAEIKARIATQPPYNPEMPPDAEVEAGQNFEEEASTPRRP